MDDILVFVLTNERAYVFVKQVWHVIKMDSKDFITEKLCLIDAPLLLVRLILAYYLVFLKCGGFLCASFVTHVSSYLLI